MTSVAERPLVSVVTAVFNGAAYLRESLYSILQQADVPFELIVVDDGSVDSTPELLREIAQMDGRVRVIRQATNTGLTVALQRGCREARGKYIARHDADDLSLPGRLRRQSQLLEKDESLSMASCWTQFLGPENELLFELAPTEDVLRATDDLHNSQGGPVHGSVMFRTADYHRVGGYHAQFRYAQDIDLWLRLSDVGRIAYVPKFLYAYRVEENSISARKGDLQRKLSELAHLCRKARLADESEEPFLEQVATLSVDMPPSRGRHRKNNNCYFIGKCLLDRRDPRAKRYLWRSIRTNPWRWRGWVALALAVMRCR